MRPTVYFSHNASARRNPKVQAMMITYGVEGYGWFWVLLELLREQPNYSYPFANKYAFRILAREMNCEPKQAEKFITDCIEEFQLFQAEGESFWNNTLKETMACMENKSLKAKEAADRKWDKKRQQDKIKDFNPSTVDANAMRTDNERNAEGLLIKESKIKINKLNEIEKKEKTKDEKYFDFVLSFYSKYFFKLIKLNNPLLSESSLLEWEEGIKKLIYENNISFGDLELAMIHSQASDFWLNKVLNTDGLNRHFNSIYKQVNVSGCDTIRKKERFDQLIKPLTNKHGFGKIASLGFNRFYYFPNKLSDFEILPNVKELRYILQYSSAVINPSELETSNQIPKKNESLSTETERYLQRLDNIKNQQKENKEMPKKKIEIKEPAFNVSDEKEIDNLWDSAIDGLRGVEMDKYEIEYDLNGKHHLIPLADSMLKKVSIFYPLLN